MGQFAFGGVLSTSFNAQIYHVDVDAAPESDYTEISIPGKSGSLLIPNNRFKNVEHKYSGVIYGTAGEVAAGLEAMKAALKSKVGYQRLTDSFNSAVYFMAVYKDSLSFVLNRERTKAKFKLSFWRKPQKFLMSGDTAITYSTSGGYITNPTAYTAKPKITVRKTGTPTTSTITIGDITATITWGSATSCTIDCETMNCTDQGGQSMNSAVSFNSLYFPELPSGSTGWESGSGIDQVSITPHWWKL